MRKIDTPTRPVIFYDTQADVSYLINSAVDTHKTGVWEADGKEYPQVDVEISAASHLFYIGKKQFKHIAGRAEQWIEREAKTKALRKKN